MFEYAATLQKDIMPSMNEGVVRFLDWFSTVPLYWHFIAALCIVLFLKSLSSRKYRK